VEGVGEDVEAEGEADPTVEVTQPARKNGAITSKRGSGDGQVLNDERRNRCDEQEPGKVVEHHGDLRVSIRAEARDGHDQHRNEEKHGRHRAGEDLDEGQDGCTSFCAPHRIRQDRLRGDHQADPDRGQSDAEWNARPVAIELDNLVGGVARTQREGKDAGNQPASEGDGDGDGDGPHQAQIRTTVRVDRVSHRAFPGLSADATSSTRVCATAASLGALARSLNSIVLNLFLIDLRIGQAEPDGNPRKLPTL